MDRASKQEELQELRVVNLQYYEENQELKTVIQHLEIENKELQAKLVKHTDGLISVMEKLEKLGRVYESKEDHPYARCTNHDGGEYGIAEIGECSSITQEGKYPKITFVKAQEEYNVSPKSESHSSEGGGSTSPLHIVKEASKEIPK
eukprot:Gb_27518 [translate_table: standard]